MSAKIEIFLIHFYFFVKKDTPSIFKMMKTNIFIYDINLII